MSLYSEMMGSFIRTGNYPMEANYIFPSEEELILFYEDPINRTTLHIGLFRIVDNGTKDEQALYWVVPNDDGYLYFEKLIDYKTISNIDELAEKLDLEIKDRIEGDLAILGTKDPTLIDLDLNTILKISEAIISIREDIKDLQEKDEELKAELKATVGTEEDDIIEYLKTLDYESLTKVSETLHYFLDSVDEEKETIDTWPELQAFLEGFGDKDTLLLILTDLWHNILGDPLPNTLFRTLRGILDFVEALKSYAINRMDNIQSELDQTQVGVGLSGDGAYNADKETYYLKDATSVMNALKILDSLINEAINNCHYESEDTETVKINITKEPTKTTIRAWVKLSSEDGNDIITKNDGIYHNIDSEYENGILTIKVNGNIRQLHVLGLSSIVETSYYDPDLEAIIIVFKLLNGEKQIVTIPAGALIQEWDVDNSISTKVVELTKVRVVSGGADKLSGDVRLSTNKYNILEKDANTLLVRGTADNIVYDGDVTVKSKLDSLTEHDNQLDNQVSDLSTALSEEIQRAKEAERDIQLSLDNEIKRSTERDELLTEQLTSEILRAKDAEKVLTDDLSAEIERSTTKDAELEKALQEEIHRAENAETVLLNNIDLEVLRATNAEEALDHKISDLDYKLETEINRSTTKDSDLEKLINDEIKRSTDEDSRLNSELIKETNRAITAETTLLNNIDLESSRAIAKEDALDHKIDDLREYLDENYSKDSELSDKVDNLKDRLDEEIIRAKFNEQELSNAIAQEVERASNAEALLDHKIADTNTALDTERNRAETAEQKLTESVNLLTSDLSDTNTKLEAEIKRSTEKDTELSAKLDSEINRATLSEEIISKELSDLISKCIATSASNASEALNALAKLGEKYATVEEIGKTLKSFLEDSDFADSTINKWQEIESFLLGITDLDTLVGLLQQITLDNKDILSDMDAKLNEEINRAKLAEQGLANKINLETERATNAEAILDHKIEDVVNSVNSEITRAKESETNLLNQIDGLNSSLSDVNDNLNKEILRSVTADAELLKNIDLETIRATSAEDNLRTQINTVETVIRETINVRIDTLLDNLNQEIARSTLKDSELDDKVSELNILVNNEITRATTTESVLSSRIDNLENSLENNTDAISDLDKKLLDEITRSTNKDVALTNLINLETLRAENAEEILRNDIQLNRLTIGSNTIRIENLENKNKDVDLTLLNIGVTIENNKNELLKAIDQEKERAILLETIIADDLNDHIHDYNNPHKVTALQLGVYTIAETDRLVNGNVSDIKDSINDLKTDLTSHINDTNNPHNVTKELIGLGKVDNTTDLEKPVSVAVQKELNDIKIELSLKAEGNDFLDHIYDYDNPHRVTKDQVGLDQVDNTSDIDKPISDRTLAALDKKSDIGHKHVMSDIEDLENLPIVKGVVELLVELPEDPEHGEKWLLKTLPNAGVNARYEIIEYDAVNIRWNQKLLTTGGIACVIDGDVYKLNSSGLERILDVSDYLYFYDKIYNETKDLIEDIDWEEDDATNDTNLQIRLKITYKTKYGDPNEAEATNPYKAKAVKYIDIDKSRFLANAYSRPAIQDDVNKGYATVVGEPLLILVMTTGDHVTISLKDSLNIYDPVDTPSIDMSVSDWTGTPSTSYKVSADVRIATTLDKTDAISLHILDSTEKGLYSTLHTTNTNSISLNPTYGTTGTLKSLTADLRINNTLNNASDVLLTIDSSGLSAKVIWGEYD